MLDDLLKGLQRGVADAFNVRMATTFLLLFVATFWAVNTLNVPPFPQVRGFLGMGSDSA